VPDDPRAGHVEDLLRVSEMPENPRRSLIAVLLFTASVAMPGVAARGRDWVVDPAGQGDATTIRRAVELAVAGDSILVRAGVYRENVIITPDKSGLYLRGDRPPGAVTIAADTVAIAIYGTTVPVRIETLTLTSTGGLNATLYTQGARAEIRSCTIRDHIGPGGCHGVGGGINLNLGSDVLIEECRIENNRDWESPGGIIVWTSRAEIRGNVFTRNQACYGGGVEMYHCASSGTSVIENNLFLENQAFVWGGGIFVVDSSPVIRRNTFVANDGAGDAGVVVLGGSPEITDNIIQDSSYGVLCVAQSGFPLSTPVIGRNLVWLAGGGAVHDCPASGQIVSLDPLFCDAAAGDFGLCANSPAVSDGVAVMGAFDVGCEACRQPGVERATWGSLKAGLR
jgi:hypothetical protein